MAPGRSTYDFIEGEKYLVPFCTHRSPEHRGVRRLLSKDSIGGGQPGGGPRDPDRAPAEECGPKDVGDQVPRREQKRDERDLREGFKIESETDSTGLC